MAEENEPAVEQSESEVVDFTLGLPVEDKPAAPSLASDDSITAEQKASAQSIAQATRDKLDKEPKVRIKVPKSKGPQTVIINMARYDIPSNVPFDVPETVARMLRDADRL